MSLGAPGVGAVSNMVYKVSCREAGYECDFLIESESKAETVDFVQRHAKGTHEMELSSEDAEGLLRTE